MRTISHLILPLALVAACEQPAPRPTNRPAQPLAGTWRALEFIDPRATDSADRWPLGRTPRAYLVYDATGHVFFQAVSGLAANPEVRGHWSGADSAALRELLRSASAYFGTYDAGAAAGTVTHHIEGEIPPRLGTTEIATPFTLRGDTLTLGRDSTVHWTFLRVRP